MTNERYITAAIVIMGSVYGSSLSAAQTDDPSKAAPAYTRPSKWQFETPLVGSDRWKKEQAEKEKLDKQTDFRLKGICTKC